MNIKPENLNPSTPLLILQVLASSSDFDWARIQSREDIGKQFELLFPSCLQRMFEVTSVADHMEAQLKHPPKVNQVAEAWASRVSQSSMSENVSVTYIDTVMTIRKRILSDERCLRMLLEADDDFGPNSPWQSVYTIEAMAKKVGVHGDVDRIAWIIAAVNYEMKAGTLDKAKMSLRNFSGKGAPGNKGHCDMILYKGALKAHLLLSELPQLGISISECQQIASRLESHSAYQQAISGGQTWVGVMTEPAQLFYTFVADVVYGWSHDQCLKNYVKTSSPVVEVLKESLQENWIEIKKAAEHLSTMQKDRSGSHETDSTPQSAKAPLAVEEVHSVALGFFRTEVLSGNTPSDASLQVTNAIQKMSYDDEEVVSIYEKKAMDRVSKFVEVLVGKSNTAAMAADLRSTDFGKIRGTEGKSDNDAEAVMIFYRPQLASEYATQTQQRVPPLRRDGACGGHYKSLVQAVLQSRLPADDEACGRIIHEGDCFVVGDGGKDGNAGAILAAFCDADGKTLAKHAKKLLAFYDEDQLSKRREAAPRSGLTLDQSESFHYITAGTLKATKRPRLHFDHSTTAGTIIGPCGLPDESDPSVWKMTIKDKKELYGAARLLPSGALPTAADSAPDSEGPKQKRARTDATAEPVTFFGMTKDLAEDLAHQAGNIKDPKSIVGVIDLTPLDGIMGNMCLERGIPYLATALTEFHRTSLLQRLAQNVFQAYLTPNNPLHAPALCKIFTPRQDDPAATELNKKEAEEQVGGGGGGNHTGGGAPKDVKVKGKTLNGARDRLLARLKGAAAAASGGEPHEIDEENDDEE